MALTFPDWIQPCGDSSLLIILGEQISISLNRQVHALAQGLKARGIPGVEECVPGYATLRVDYDPLKCSVEDLLHHIQEVWESLPEDSALSAREVVIPVHYGGEDGPDLPFVAQHTGLSEEEVIRRHTAGRYPVFLMGFLPGFPYLGGMDESLATPRLDTPRQRVPAGSVGIAGKQTGVYPLDSPGGWRIIGRTSLTLFDVTREPPFLLQPGDVVRFVAVEA
ncbi:5-oxoprolinase subunit PxpB [Anaerolinea sp.]|uniref:5-oxoprolinase subunit PxpB n=1 Tax=Anaerolinea sp. TaxID=1872519 RepID=UPI002ACD224C|nr:5-oxoprolinase subunit PxpB [Anaerolinea sp.]